MKKKYKLSTLEASMTKDIFGGEKKRKGREREHGRKRSREEKWKRKDCQIERDMMN